MHIRRERLAFGTILRSLIAEIAEIFLLFRVNGNDRLTGSQKHFHLIVDGFKLGVAVGMVNAFACFAIRLKAVTHLVQQAANNVGANVDVSMLQLFRKFLNAFARPPQRRFGIAPRDRINQGVEFLTDVRINCLGLFSSATWKAASMWRECVRRVFFDLPQTASNGFASDARGLLDDAFTTPANMPSFSRRPNATPPFVQDIPNCFKFLTYRFKQLCFIHRGIVQKSQFSYNANLGKLFKNSP